MNNGLMIDVAFALVLVLGIVFGAKRGLFRSFMALAAILIALIGASLLTDLLTEPVTELLMPRAEKGVEEWFRSWDVNAEGERAYASYFEVAYPFSVKGVDMKAGVGMVPWNAVGTYGIDRDFYVQNVFLNAGKSWNIKGTESMSIGIFTNLVWNPAMEDVNFVGGFSFRM
mgnify:CR=1 FL=1